jgi:short-subunit dehydrogenase
VLCACQKNITFSRMEPTSMTAIRGAAAAVTGAASGIGRALALELAARGCDLALADRDEAGLAAVAAEIAKTGTTKITTHGVVSATPARSRRSRRVRSRPTPTSTSSSTMPAWR